MRQRHHFDPFFTVKILCNYSSSFPDGGRPIPFRKITNWKRVSTALEKIDTPNLNSIPNDIASTDEIDLAIGALTNHVRTVVEERASGGSGILGSPEVSARYSRIDKSKNAVCAARAHIPLPSTDPERELSNAK
ncbi:hypothetical protein EVAR_28375_1 [Eumeta japonica]|uniref:Uncharacterized protein n=1 Tax=Eumeta variegata TaxID=151549 RepID=A0A4C1XG36_EUMVA|nr:hypothetical protein EVAR_28375_1 [Eumeta japonica]